MLTCGTFKQQIFAMQNLLSINQHFFCSGPILYSSPVLITCSTFSHASAKAIKNTFIVPGYWSQKIHTLTYPSSQLGDGSLYLPNVILPLLQYVAQQNNIMYYQWDQKAKAAQPSKQLINMSCFTTHINKVQSLNIGNDISCCSTSREEVKGGGYLST